jgi:hypothetical protein
MSTKQLLAAIERGIKALQKAQALCLKAESAAPKTKGTATKTVKVAATKGTKRVMSDASRAKIAAAQQKRWAKFKRAKKKAAKAALAVAAKA